MQSISSKQTTAKTIDSVWLSNSRIARGTNRQEKKNIIKRFNIPIDAFYMCAWSMFGVKTMLGDTSLHGFHGHANWIGSMGSSTNVQIDLESLLRSVRLIFYFRFSPLSISMEFRFSHWWNWFRSRYDPSHYWIMHFTRDGKKAQKCESNNSNYNNNGVVEKPARNIQMNGKSVRRRQEKRWRKPATW